jgi:hypothetical protein
MIGVAGIASSFAQNVYSVNVVGYINLTLTTQFSLIADQLDNGADNYVTNLFAPGTLPNGTVFYKYNLSTKLYDQLTWNQVAGGWLGNAVAKAMTLKPGEGVFLKKPTTNVLTVTFVGEVMQGDLVNPVDTGLDIYSGMVPQEGGISTVHGYVSSVVNNPAPPPAQLGDSVYNWTGTGWSAARSWLPSANRWSQEPTLKVGEAVLINSRGTKNWTRTFNVN